MEVDKDALLAHFKPFLDTRRDRDNWVVFIEKVADVATDYDYAVNEIELFIEIWGKGEFYAK